LSSCSRLWPSPFCERDFAPPASLCGFTLPFPEDSWGQWQLTTGNWRETESIIHSIAACSYGWCVDAYSHLVFFLIWVVILALPVLLSPLLEQQCRRQALSCSSFLCARKSCRWCKGLDSCRIYISKRRRQWAIFLPDKCKIYAWGPNGLTLELGSHLEFSSEDRRGLIH
jgi:hypothetical protein